MAKVIIEFDDNDDGQVDVKLNFYPELKTEGQATSAQYMAIRAVKYLREIEEKNE